MAGELKAGRYEVEQQIGRGGMGLVYRARDNRLHRIVALKMLPREATHDSDLRRRLAREARAASAITHPGVATVYDFEEHSEESFIVYEYVEGVTLREKLGKGRFTTEEVLDVGVQLADALAAAQERGIVHRDLKPENIMLTPGLEGLGRVKILDFGLAKMHKPLTAVNQTSATTAETAAISTAAGLLVGTVNYMSPEQLEGGEVDHRTDIYALGLVLYEIATGANPFVGKTPTSTIANILKQEPPPVVERNPVAPAELDRIARKCLRKRREERYQSARELQVDLSNLRRDLAPAAGRASSEGGAISPVPLLVFPRRTARVLFALSQMAYLVMYLSAFYHWEAVISLSLAVFHNHLGFWLLVACALPGTPVRLYLLSAVAADYFDIGRKFRWLFPALLVLDLAWALLPLVLFPKVGLLALVFVAGLAYLPFVQRRLLYDAYSPKGGRVAAVKTPSPD